MNFINDARRRAAIFLRIHLFVKRRRADQVMRRFLKRRSTRFCRQQIEAAINLKRVRADNFCAETVRDISRQIRFPGCSWTDDKKRAIHQSDPAAFYLSRAALTIWTKLRGSRLAPPTRAPSISG